MDAMGAVRGRMITLFKQKKKELSIDFWTTVPGLSQIKEVTPKKQSSSLPDWWRNTPYYNKSIKQCPSFSQMFSTSYMIPMWCDTRFTRNGDELTWETPNHKFYWQYHSDSQFLKYAPAHIKNKFFTVAKAVSPWRIKTPKGYSVYQIPAHWHFNEKFFVPTGIIDTDFQHEVNQQVFLSIEDGESLLIERGTPLVTYFPFKRDSFKLNVREETEKDRLADNTSFLIYTTKFLNAYRDHQNFIKEKND